MEYPLSFNQRYHLATLEENKARQNKDGSMTTVMGVGIPYNGNIYNVPSYDRETGEVITDKDELLQRWMPDIVSGGIKPYPQAFDGDISDHPANVAARQEHEWIERNRGGFDNVKFNKRLEDRGLLGDFFWSNK